MTDFCLDSLHQYLCEISEYPLLTLEEEKMYFKKYACANDEEKQNIRNLIIECNLRLVVFNAKRYRNLGVDFLDLVQAGNFGLLEAIDKFDSEWKSFFYLCNLVDKAEVTSRCC